MTNFNRDVTLAVGIKTTGEDALRSLAAEVQNLAKRGGDAAPAYEQLANELGRLSQQAAQLDVFKTLAADVERLTADQVAASKATAELSESLKQQQRATLAAAEAESAAQAALKETRDALAGKRYELAQLNIDTTKAAKGEDDYLSKSKALKQAILEGTSEVRSRRDALRTASEQVDAAEAAETKLAAQYERSAKASGLIDTALQAQREAMQRTVTTAEQLGLSITDVTAAEEKLLSTQQKLVGGVADARVAAAREQAEADRQAITEAQGLAELYDRGRVALIAETTAINEASEASQRYARFQAEVAQLIAQEQRAADALRATAAATTKANEAALQASKNADYLRFWAQAADELARKEREAAEAAEFLRAASERAAVALKDAFGQTGVRGLQAIQNEVNLVNSSVGHLEQQFRAGAISAQDLARATSSAQVRLAQLRQEAETLPALPNAFEKLSSSINGAIGRFGALGAAIATIGVVVKPVLDATVELERMTRVLTSVTGSSTEAARQIEFLRGVAQKAGQNFSETGDAYAKFAAAAVSSGISLKTIQNTFEAVSLAAGNLGLSSDQVSRILNALGQSASKGVIQMEELRGQLGDALPGALSLMAKGLGLTDVQLNKLVESGGLLARDALPALASALSEMAPKDGQGVSGLVAEFNRLKNVVIEASTILTDGAFGKSAGAVLGVLGSAIEKVSFGVAYLGESFTVVGRQIGATVAAITTGDFKHLGETLSQITEESTVKLAGLAARIDGTGTAASGAAVGAKTLADSMRDATLQVGKVAEQQAAASAATGAAAATATTAAASWVLLSAKLSENVAIAEKAAVVADTLAKAKKIEADAAAAVIAISGNEVNIRAANAAAATAEAKALQGKADADAVVAQRLREGLDALQERAKAEGRVDDATKKAIETLKQNVAAKEADAEKSRQQADAARVHAAALDVQSKSLQDNSGRVRLYRDELDRATSALQSAIYLMGRDKATKEDVQRATEAVAKAEGLLRDAISDRAKRTEAAIEVMKLDHQIKRAGLQIQLEESKAAQITAQARGDELSASREAVKQKQIEIALSRDAVAQSIEEANTRKQAALDELADTQDLTPEKRLELELRIKNADAMKAEALARQAGTKVIEAEKTALEQRNQAAASRTSGGSSTGGTGSAGTSSGTRTGTSSTAGNIDGSGMGSFSSSVTKTSGLMAGQGGGAVDASYVFDLWSRYQQGRVAADELPNVQNALAVAESNARLGSAGSVSFEGKADDQMWITRLKQIVAALSTTTKVKPTGISAAANGTASTSASSTATATAAAMSGTRVVRVEFGNGQSTTVRMASVADADNLENLLQKLAQHSMRSAS